LVLGVPALRYETNNIPDFFHYPLLGNKLDSEVGDMPTYLDPTTSDIAVNGEIKAW
jgi:hypothetical protein